MTRGENRITGLTVEGFKSIRDRQSIELKPLTVLAGANSSGKSSIMQPLLLLKQTLESAGDPGAILLNGDHVQFSSGDQVLSRLANAGRSGHAEFTLELDISDYESLLLRFKKAERSGFEAVEMRYENCDEEHFSIRPGMSHAEIVDAIPPSWKQTLFEGITRKGEDKSLSVVRDRCFLDIRFRRMDSSEPGWSGPGAVPFMPRFESRIEGIIHLPGLRGNPRRTYPRMAAGPVFEGTFEHYVASLVDAWQRDQNANLERLEGALRTLGLTWRLRAEGIDDTQIQLKAGRLPIQDGESDMVSIADMGLGISQSLPVLVSLIAAQPGQLVYIEQPEIHLHPLAQRRLAHVLIDAIQHGANVVIETHSSLLLRELQTAVASDKLDPGMMVLHWFSRDKNGWSQISTAEPDENGAYGDWPADFDATELEAERAYLDAVEARGAGE